MAKVYKLKFYGKTYNVALGKAHYVNNGKVAVLMYTCTPKGKIKEDFGDLTVNIADSDIMANEKDEQFIDTNNLGHDIVKWLVDNKIAIETGIYGFSGFCMYPLMTFSKEALDGMVDLEQGE